jgi:hypothetical protein
MMLARQGMNFIGPVEARPLGDELTRYRLEVEGMRQRLVDFISTASDVMY